jgi:hypothetical protein
VAASTTLWQITTARGKSFELLRAQGVPPDFEIASAKVQAAEFPNDDPGAQFLVDTASKFLDRLDAVALPSIVRKFTLILSELFGRIRSSIFWHTFVADRFGSPG